MGLQGTRAGDVRGAPAMLRDACIGQLSSEDAAAPSRCVCGHGDGKLGTEFFSFQVLQSFYCQKKEIKLERTQRNLQSALPDWFPPCYSSLKISLPRNTGVGSWIECREGASASSLVHTCNLKPRGQREPVFTIHRSSPEHRD